MGDNSYLRGRGFESQRRLLDGHFFTLICCKNCIVCLKRPKINEKEAEVGPFVKKRNNVIMEVSFGELSFRNSHGYQMIEAPSMRISFKIYFCSKLFLRLNQCQPNQLDSAVMI